MSELWDLGIKNNVCPYRVNAETDPWAANNEYYIGCGLFHERPIPKCSTETCPLQFK